MDCNKEEALRAKNIAEKKMQSKDFPGARNFILKAQKLDPEIENVSRLLSVCDVHCSAENKMFGNDKDWYGILQVEQTADDMLIRKHYRKFALLLHPDKNTYPGAEAAFKLIGEAQRVLLDKQKRSIHDMRRRTFFKAVIPHQPAQQSSRPHAQQSSRPQSNFPSNPNSHVNASKFSQQGQAQHSQSVNGKETFWTLCLHCFTKYQYYKDILGKALLCNSCKKPFVSYDMYATQSGDSQGAPPSSNVESKAKNVTPTFDAGIQADQKADFSRSQDRQTRKELNKMDSQGNGRCKRQKFNSPRGKKRIESSSESFESDSSLDSEEVEMHEAADLTRSQHIDNDGSRQTRRSNRNKRRVSYNEKASDDDQEATSSGKAKGNSSTEEKVVTSNNFGSTIEEENTKKESNTNDGNETSAGSTKKRVEVDDGLNSSVDQTPESTPTPTVLEYPDPEFCDFDKDREKECFKVGQLWAVYDTVDAMPRFYAKIKKIYASEFKMQITWLEANPGDEAGKGWIASNMPYPCGKFKLGITEITEDRPMFSHAIPECIKHGRNSFSIYPREGDIWAVFKNWGANWCLVPENERKFEYEAVEILSNHDDFEVVMLDPVQGYTSVFQQRKIRNSIVTRVIPRTELLRFSHQIPCFRLTDEKGGTLRGCIELDLAALPT